MRFKLQALPRGIEHLSKLRILSIDNNIFPRIPKGIGELRELRSINLSHNEISTIPSSFSTLSNLVSSFDFTFPSSIVHLNISDNYLNEFPLIPMNNLLKLKYVDIEGNQISVIPDEISKFSELEVLFLGRNNISVLPSALTQLQHLYRLSLCHNHLSSIPFQFNPAYALRV
jgi:internalin A